ncbi:fasciclin domain-containing protein [Aquabacterium sp.]|uniref:fasciclin domain-containing protein n=1 Tax=Aquabacterium sp. TaxID=1872578 RepID=UPI003BB112EE
MNALSKRQFLKLSLASGVALSLSACGGGDERDIVEVLSDYPEYSLLVEAVQAAGLVDTLKGRGPFTVFAPTNTAFVNLLGELETTKDALFANKPLLTAVLTYHVLAARVPAADIPFGRAITTVETGIFKIDNVGGPVITDERNRTASITVTNLYASNGVIHGIDKVILPGDKDIVATAQSIPDFSILVEAVVAADLVSTLQGAGPFTVFAPTNAAFAAALSELDVSKDDLFANTELLTQILTYHVVPARVLKAEVPLNTDITTVESSTFQVNSSLQIVDVANRLPNIVTTDVLTSNGVIHVIDRVILPFVPTVPV